MFRYRKNVTDEIHSRSFLAHMCFHQRTRVVSCYFSLSVWTTDHGVIKATIWWVSVGSGLWENNLHICPQGGRRTFILTSPGLKSLSFHARTRLNTCPDVVSRTSQSEQIVLERLSSVLSEDIRFSLTKIFQCWDFVIKQSK